MVDFPSNITSMPVIFVALGSLRTRRPRISTGLALVLPEAERFGAVTKTNGSARLTESEGPPSSDIDRTRRTCKGWRKEGAIAGSTTAAFGLRFTREARGS